jgi:hypothetical protein
MTNPEWLGMTRKHYQEGTLDRVRMVVLHSTAGTGPGDLSWLRNGGHERAPVSVHYYIAKSGRTVQLVADKDVAWHAGISSWTVDGTRQNGLNAVSLGIELENRNDGRDPYPEAQFAAAVTLTRRLVTTYGIPRAQLVRHLDISPGRKTDPAGFAWERFVQAVFAGLPDQLPLPPAAALRRQLIDVAFKAARSALPAEWPLWQAAKQAAAGMPVATVTARPANAALPGSRERALALPNGRRYLLELYARDAFFAEPSGDDDQPPSADQVQRLSTVQDEPLRDAVLTAIFRAVDPVNGWQPGWAFHQHYLRLADQLGMPIGHNHRLRLADGGDFAVQHFALDSLVSPVGRWQVIYRLSDLRAAADGETALTGINRVAARRLAQLVLDDLYAARTGRRYQATASLVRFAETQQLGAPLGPPELLLLDETPILVMPFALDVVTCRLPNRHWPLDRPLPPGSAMGRLTTMLGSVLGRADDLPFARMSTLGDSRLPGVPSGPEPLLGAVSQGRPLVDVSLFVTGGERRQAAIDQLLIVATPGPMIVDLHEELQRARWHYYVDRDGTVLRLREEYYVARAARTPGGDRDEYAQRALVIAVEGGLEAADSATRDALSTLVRALARRHGLESSRIRVEGSAATVTAPLPAQSVAEGVRS